MRRVCWYNLPLTRDERQLIYSKLGYSDWIVARIAHTNEIGTLLDFKFVNDCAIRGYLELFQLANSSYYEYLIFENAAKNEHFHIMEYMDDFLNIDWLFTLRLYAMKNGNLNILKWIYHKNDYLFCDTFICGTAAFYGHLHIIQWARSLDPPLPWNEYVCPSALRYGHMDLLKWCVEHGAPMDEFVRNHVEGLFV